MNKSVRNDTTGRISLTSNKICWLTLRRSADIVAEGGKTPETRTTSSFLGKKNHTYGSSQSICRNTVIDADVSGPSSLDDRHDVGSEREADAIGAEIERGD